MPRHTPNPFRHGCDGLSQPLERRYHTASEDQTLDEPAYPQQGIQLNTMFRS